MSDENGSPVRLLHSIQESCFLLGGISPALFFELKKNGRIKTVSVGNRTFVSRTELERIANDGVDHQDEKPPPVEGEG